MLDSQETTRIITQQAAEFCTSRPDLRLDVGKLMIQFKRKFAAVNFLKVSDIFDLCRDVDNELSLSEELKSSIVETRQRILVLLIETFYSKKKAALWGDAEALRQASNEADLAKLLAKLIPSIRQKIPEGEEFDQKWIRNNEPEIYTRIKELITDRDTRVEKWNLLQEMMPADLKDRFEVKRIMSREQSLLEKVKPYRDLAIKMGPEVVAEFLISIGAVSEGEFSRTVGIISEYLGRCKVPKPILSDVAGVPEAMLKLPSIRRWMFIRIRNHVYRELVKAEQDSGSVVAHKAALRTIKGTIAKILKTKLDVAVVEHKQFFDEVMLYFERVLDIRTPERMVSSLTDRNGEVHFFPSLRQRIAMMEISGALESLVGMEEEERENPRNCKKLLEFFMGKGKTGAAFLAKEHVFAKKMLYICPPGKLVDEVRDRVTKYYKEGLEPSVGVICAGMSIDELREVLLCEVVIFPYSMFGGQVADKRIVDEVKKHPFDFMTIDEIHYARKDSGRNTKVLLELATGIPDLYEEGNMAMLTGNSTPNRADDIVPQLRLWDNEAYGDIGSVREAARRMGPLSLRNAVCDMIVLLDEPEDWEQHVESLDLSLSPDEMRIYNGILQDEELDHGKKLQLLYLCAMNPGLFVPTMEIKSSFIESLCEKVDEILLTEDVVVIAENALKHGLLREHASLPGTSLVKKIRDHLGEEVEIFLIDGDTSRDDRREAFEASKRKGVKTVIVAMGDIIRVGIDLSHISRAICLNPSWNKPDFAQLVKRFAREGNEDAKVTLMTVLGTVHEGILEHSEEKDAETQLLKFGGALTDDDIALAERGDFSEKVVVNRGRVYLGTIIRNKTMTDAQKLNRIFSYIDGLGEEKLRQFFEQHGEEFAELYVRVWERGYGGNNGRFTAGLWKHLEEGGFINPGNYGDLGCGHLVLENTLADTADLKSRIIFNLDLNGHMLEAGKELLKKKRPGHNPRVKLGSFTDMRGVYPDGMFSAVNLGMSIYCTKLGRRSKDLHKDERVQTLLELNRVLRPGGIAVLTLPSNTCSPEEALLFTEQLGRHFGMESLKEFTGRAQSTDTNLEDNLFENYTIVVRKTGEPDINGLDLEKLRLTRTRKVSGTKDGIRHAESAESGRSDEGYIHTQFQINSLGFEFDSGVDQKKKEQEKFMNEVVDTRVYLKGVYQDNGNSLRGLAEGVREELVRRGITPVDYGGDSPGFILASDPVEPKQLFYVFDDIV
ncbi:MAG: methyltransferase domain-containing protein [bacterium]|nr:methyltransferase domain-containing protein [bacterium]